MFSCTGVSSLNSYVVQGSTVFNVDGFLAGSLELSQSLPNLSFRPLTFNVIFEMVGFKSATLLFVSTCLIFFFFPFPSFYAFLWISYFLRFLFLSFVGLLAITFLCYFIHHFRVYSTYLKLFIAYFFFPQEKENSFIFEQALNENVMPITSNVCWETSKQKESYPFIDRQWQTITYMLLR